MKGYSSRAFLSNYTAIADSKWWRKLTDTNKNLGQVFQGITLRRYSNDSGKPYQVISVRDLENLYIETVHSESRLDVPDIQRYRLQENDVVIAIRGDLLKSSVVTDATAKSVCNQNTVFFRQENKGGQVNPLYLAALLRSDYFKQVVSANYQRSTSGLPAIRVSDLRDLQIPIPNSDIQNQLAQLFLSIEAVRTVTESALNSRQRLAQIGLLQAIGEQC